MAPTHLHFDALDNAFAALHAELPAATSRWILTNPDPGSLVRLSFGMGVSARFHPDAHAFVRAMLEAHPCFSRPVLDVVECFHWHPAWSVALAR